MSDKTTTIKDLSEELADVILTLSRRDKKIKFLETELADEREQFTSFKKAISRGEDMYYHFKTIELQKQVEELTKLTGNFPDGMGDYEWKLVENYNSKNHELAELQKQVEDLKDELFKLIPVTFHGDKKAFNDSGFTKAFKEMVIQAYLQNQKP